MKVQSIAPKEWNGKAFAEVTLDGRVYSNWQAHWKMLKPGDDVIGEVTEKGPGKTPQIKITAINGVSVGTSGGAWTPQAPQGASGGGDRNNSFAASYSKDVIVALINAGTFTDMGGIKMAFGELYDMFMEKLR